MVGSRKIQFLGKSRRGDYAWLQKSTKVPNNGKFVRNIAGWDPFWCVDLKIFVDQEFLQQIWGKRSCYWLNVASHRVIE